MEFEAYILATILAAFIDFLRIKAKKGEVANIQHVWSWLIGGVFLLICVLLLKIEHWIVYTFVCIGIRAVFYDPVLNLLRQLPIDYTSKTTTSRIDKWERLVNNFWVERLLYVAYTSAVLAQYYNLNG